MLYSAQLFWFARRQQTPIIVINDFTGFYLLFTFYVVCLYRNPKPTTKGTIMATILKVLIERVGEDEAIILYNRYRWAVGRLTIRGETLENIAEWILTASKKEGTVEQAEALLAVMTVVYPGTKG